MRRKPAGMCWKLLLYVCCPPTRCLEACVDPDTYKRSDTPHSQVARGLFLYLHFYTETTGLLLYTRRGEPTNKPSFTRSFRSWLSYT